MFENIIGQQTAVDQLRKELSTGTLPGALLFHGAPYTGKLSTALELCRGLTCRQEGAWSCSCHECEMQRRLGHPNIVLIGKRYFAEEIAACGEVLLRKPALPTQYMFIRSIRKLTRRFDPVIWEGNENKIKGILSELEKVEGVCEAILPVLPENNKELEKLVKKAVDGSQKIVKGFKQETIPIDQVRNVNGWVHTSGYPKVVILEEAEAMSDGSRNALLKTLEEPPEGTYFILLTAKKEDIMPTIRSRVREYTFKDRSADQEQVVLEKIFREDEKRFSGLREFFLAWKGINVIGLKNDAKQWMNIIFNETRDIDFNELLKNLQDNTLFDPFLEELAFACRRMLHEDNTIPPEIIHRFSLLINETMKKHEIYHQNQTLLLESLFYRMQGSTP